MIGLWDDTGCNLCMPFSAWGRGNGTANQNTGNMPTYPNGAHQPCVFTNMGAGYGYVYVPGADSYCNFDGVNDYVSSQFARTFSNAGSITLELKIHYMNDGNDRYFFMFGDNINAFAGGYAAGATNAISWFIKSGANTRSATSNETLVQNTDYTLHFVKNGATLQLFINGVEATYAVQQAYNLGNLAIVRGVDLGIRQFDLSRANTSRVYWFATYDNTVLSNARLTTNAGLSNTFGLVGTNVGNTMYLAQPVTPPSQSTVSCQCGVRIG